MAEDIDPRAFERLQAWMAVGCALGELGRDGDRYVLRGVRAQALASLGGDPLLRAHYRSVLDYQTGPYAELEELLRTGSLAGRSDLDHHDDDIARVSLAAAPFVSAYLGRVVRDRRPRTILDVGCGTAVYARVALDAQPTARVTGIDRSRQLIDRTRSSLEAEGLGDRVELVAADVRAWAPTASGRFDLVMAHNSIYYFAVGERVDLYRTLGDLLAVGGELILTTMTTPGSIAAAHLDFMLTCQAGGAALPSRAAVVRDLASAGLVVTEDVALVPTEPYRCYRAVRSVARSGPTARGR